MAPVIRFISALQVAFSGYVYGFVPLCNRPICRFFLRLESLHFLMGDNDGVMCGTSLWIRGHWSVLYISCGHETPPP